MSTCETPQTWFYRGREAASALAGRGISALEARAAAFAEEVPGAGRHACARGCSFCCFFPVGVRGPELRRLADELRARGDTELALWRARLADEARERERLGWAALAAARRPCVFLDDAGACRVHAQRPLACRAWNSFDRDSCERVFRSDPGAQPALDAPLHYALLGLGAGLADALRARGEDPESYELVSGLAHELDALPTDPPPLRVGGGPAD